MQEQKKAMSSRHSAYIPPSVKLPGELILRDIKREDLCN